MGANVMATPALPKGFVLEGSAPALPAGFVLESDQPAQKVDQGADIAAGATRGMAPYAGGAALGAAAGAPLAGVGAIPGAIAGAGAVALSQFVGDPVIGAINAAFGTNITTPSQALDELMTRAGIPQVQTTAGRIAQAASAGATGAGGMAAAGKAMQSAAGQAAPMISGIGKQLATGVRQSVAGGAGAGIGGQVAAESGAGIGGQIAASLLGGVAGAKAAGSRIAPSPKATAQQQAVAEAGSAGIPVLTSDIRQPTTFAGKWAQTAGERVPVAGTGPVRATQQAARVDAVKQLIQDFGADADNLADDVLKNLTAKRSSELGKYAGMKNAVIDRLDDVGEVPMTRTTTAIESEVKRLKSMKSPESFAVADKLESFGNAIQGQGLRNIEELRKQLGDAFKGESMSNIRSTAEKSLQGLYGPLKQDMGDFIRANGMRRDVDKWMIADKNLSGMIGEVNQTALKTALDRGQVDATGLQTMLFGKKPGDLRVLYRNLTPDGQANARAAILQKAFAGTDGSPEKFVNNLSKLDQPVKAFFKDDDLNRLEGLQRALKLTRRAGDAGINPPTGQQLALPVGAAVLADLLGSGGAAIATGSGIGGAARIYESAPVRNLLISIPRLKAGSPEEAAAVKRLIAVIQQQQQNKEEK